jgi:hypothetical protein
LNIIVNWGSLLFASSANFVIPFLLYFASRRDRSRLAGITGDPLAVSLSKCQDHISLRTIPSVAGSNNSSHASAHQHAQPGTSIAITPARDDTPDTDTEFPDVPKLTVIKDPDEPLSPLASPEISDFEFKDIGESSALGVRRPEETELPPSRTASIRSERIVSSMQLRAPRSRRTQSISSSVSRDLERGEGVVPRIVHSSVQQQSRDSGSGSDNSDAASVYQQPEWNDSSERLESANTTPEMTNGAPLFHAFRETRWVRSVVIAKIGFVIMTLMVLGNLIYSYDRSPKRRLIAVS